jgi:hypothetical protein
VTAGVLGNCAAHVGRLAWRVERERPIVAGCMPQTRENRRSHDRSGTPKHHTSAAVRKGIADGQRARCPRVRVEKASARGARS